MSVTSAAKTSSDASDASKVSNAPEVSEISEESEVSDASNVSEASNASNASSASDDAATSSKASFTRATLRKNESGRSPASWPCISERQSTWARCCIRSSISAPFICTLTLPMSTLGSGRRIMFFGRSASSCSKRARSSGCIRITTGAVASWSNSIRQVSIRRWTAFDESVSSPRTSCSARCIDKFSKGA